MLFATTSTSDLVANVGSVSSVVYGNALPWAIVAVGIPLAFYIVKKLIGLLPKSK